MTTQQQTSPGQVPTSPDRQAHGVNWQVPAGDRPAGRRDLYQRCELDEAVRLYRQGRSIREIARVQGRGYATVRNHLVDLVVMRSRGGWHPGRAQRQGQRR